MMGILRRRGETHAGIFFEKSYAMLEKPNSGSPMGFTGLALQLF
jgi:hypothetical protein